LPRRPISTPDARATVYEPLVLPLPKMTLFVTFWSQASAGAPKVIFWPPR